MVRLTNRGCRNHQKNEEMLLSIKICYSGAFTVQICACLLLLYQTLLPQPELEHKPICGATVLTTAPPGSKNHICVGKNSPVGETFISRRS